MGYGIRLLILSVLILQIPGAAFAQAGPSPDDGILILGNEHLPPLVYVRKRRPAGIVVDLVSAMAERMSSPAEIRAVDWEEAQGLVLSGRADALMQMNPTPERRELYDFSQPLLDSEFMMFADVKKHRLGSLDDLSGLRVGVEATGLPVQLLREEPEIIAVAIPDFLTGFRMIGRGDLDVLIADRWVGSWILATNSIRDIKPQGEPIHKSRSAIAVRKGNTALLREIDAALAAIRKDGTYERILAAWSPEEILLTTWASWRRLVGASILAAAVIAVLLTAAVWAQFLAIRRYRRSEARVAALAKEKELLLRETHHRIKNNMNTVYGLLIIQAEASEDGDTQGALAAAAARVRSMGILYDRLYRAETPGIVGLRDFLEPLAKDIVGDLYTGTAVDLRMELADIPLGADTAMPLGIIVNELISNSIKHAFGARAAPLITVEARLDGSWIALRYADNGCGMPAMGKGDSGRGFGMSLIGDLTAQIGGTLHRESGPGTVFTLRFPVKKTKARS